MNMRLLTLIILTLAVTLSGQGHGKGKSKGKRSGNSRQTAVVSVVFTESDQHAIRQWAQVLPSSNLPPGLARRGDLPPGLQKHLRKNGTLPPGLQKKISYFPADLNRRLGPLPAGCGCDRIFLDGKALVIARATSAILDVISLF
jgi:hypothetical protein